MNTILKDIIKDYENCDGNCKECLCYHSLSEIVDTTANIYLCGLFKTIEENFEKFGTKN